MKLNGKVGVLACIAAMGMFAAVGCSSDSKSGSNMGAVGEKATCKKKADGAMGAVSETKAGCCKAKAAEGNMGAVSEKKAGCCKSAVPQS